MKGKMKVSWFLVVVLVMSAVLSACSNESSGNSDGEVAGEITVWTHPFVGEELKDEQSKMWEEMKTSFEEQYPDATVKFEEIPWQNREQKILTALASNNGPDVFYIIPDQLSQFADKGVLGGLSDHLEDSDTEDFVQSALDAGTYQGELYALPILREVQTYYYNTNVLEDIGASKDDLPETWEEFNALAEKAKENGYYARNFEGSNTLNSTLYPLIWQSGGGILTSEGEIEIGEKDAVEAFQLVNDWYENEYVPADSVSGMDQFNLFLENKTVSAWAAQSALSVMKAKGFEDYVIGPPLKQDEQAGFGVTGMFTVPSNADNTTGAVEFIKHMTNKENMIKFNQLTKYIPPRESASEMFADDPDMKKLSGYVKYARPGVMHPVARSIMPKIQAELQAMMEGKKSPEDAANAAAEAIQSEIDKNQ